MIAEHPLSSARNQVLLFVCHFMVKFVSLFSNLHLQASGPFAVISCAFNYSTDNCVASLFSLPSLSPSSIFRTGMCLNER